MNNKHTHSNKCIEYLEKLSDPKHNHILSYFRKKRWLKKCKFKYNLKLAINDNTKLNF